MLAPVAGWVAPVGASVVSWSVLSAALACGGQPSAVDLWALPGGSRVHDAHATITALGTAARVVLQGDGIVVFKPRTAMSLRLQSPPGAMPGELDVLEAGGVTYERTAAGKRWARSARPAPDPTGARATTPTLLGQETLVGGRAWHLMASRAGSPVEMWVRMSDGYPLKLVTAGAGGTIFTFAFDRFNTGAGVAAPLAVELEPPARHLSGGLGDTLPLNAARIAVVSIEDGAVADGELVQARPGNRFVLVEVTVENTSDGQLNTFLDWRLTDAVGGAWEPALSVREPAFAGGELVPGGTSRGFLTFEVPGTIAPLMLTVRLDDDTASFALS